MRGLAQVMARDLGSQGVHVVYVKGAKGQTLSQTFAEKTGTDENLPVISGVNEVVPRGIEPRFAT
jgi:hypothetical protein